MRKFIAITTSDEKGNNFSKYSYTYICDSSGNSLRGHHLWLSDAFAAGFSFLHFTKKDNHMPQIIRTVHYVKWKQIEQFPDFYISNTGLVRFRSTIIKPKTRTGRKDYLYFIARNQDLNLCHRLDVHRTIWDHFGNEPHKEGYEVHHKDLNPQNNHIDNLELIPMPKHRRLHKELRGNI